MAVLRYFHQDPRQTSVQESSVIDKQGTVLTQKLTTINQSITNNTQVLEDKQNSVPGKSLSTNDFTDEYKNKLRGIEEGAEVNVQSDWGEDDNTADSYIKNKPVIDDIVTQNSENLITSGAVFTAIDELPEPMIFKGSLGTGGTIQTLPAPSADNVGFVYKVITAGTYYGITAKPGDSFISDSSDWILIPSGDEPEGTVMSVGLSVPTGLQVSGSPVTTSGTLAITYALGYAIPTTAKQAEWDAKQNAISDLSTIRTNASNGNTAYGWGNHANAGYQAAISDLATIRSNASEGHTAYGWGNHANAGYVKSSGVTSVAMTVPTGLSISGSPITSTGTLALSFANGYSIPTTAKQSNWDTAYGWGNHANAGYLKQHQSLAGYLPLSGGTMTGNISFSDNTGISAVMGGGTDNWGIIGTGTGDAGRLKIYVGDNGVSDWMDFEFRDYTGTTYTPLSMTGNSVKFTVNPTVNGNSIWHAGNLTNLNQLTNGPGYITGITKTMVTNALGYTPPTTDTNTWRGITDSYSGTDSSISLSQKGGNSLYNALVNGYANEAGTLAIKYKLTDGSTSSVTGYRLFGSQTLSGGWQNKRIAFLVCDRHTSNGIVFINYGIETAASAYTWNAAYCDIKYFGATSDTSLLMYCYVKLNNTNSVTFNFFWNHSDYSELDIRLLQTWNSPFTISNDGAFVSSIDTNTYGTLKATMQRNEAINADTLDGYHYNNLPYLTGITKAMVTTALGYTPPTSDTNNSVTQTNTATTNGNYRVLMSATADDTTRTEGARKSTNLYFNPSIGKLSVSQSIQNTDVHNRSGGWNTYEQFRGISIYDCTGSSDRGAPSNYYATGLHVAGQYWFQLAFERGDNRLLYRGGNAEGVTRSWSRIHTYGDNEYACAGKMYIQCGDDDGNVIIGANQKNDDSDGPWVGIGKMNPSYKLHVNGACGATSHPTTSDIRIKDIQSDVSINLEDIANAPLFLFKWKEGGDNLTHVGTSAQYWKEKVPELVSEANDERKTLSLEYEVLGTAGSIAIAKEVVSLKEEIKLLQAQIAELKQLLNN